MLDPEFDPENKPSFLRFKVKNERGLLKKQKRLLEKQNKKQMKSLNREITKDTMFINHEKTKYKMENRARVKAKWIHEYQNLMTQAKDSNTLQMVGRKMRKRLIKKGYIKGY